MMKYHAHDTVNDVAIIQTELGFNVRYGLNVICFPTLGQALKEFTSAQRHALACAGNEVAA